MNGPLQARQTTLLTSHKGVDLHAASALLVMQDRLTGGEKLVNLLRCELHAFWGEPQGWTVERLLATGRYFNPNKHHCGVFGSGTEVANWLTRTGSGLRLTTDWLAEVLATDLAELQADAAGLYGTLLGGRIPTGCAPCDIVGFAAGQTGPVLSGVLWRLVIRGDERVARAVGEELAIARHRKQGLLINPHMDNWFVVA